MKTDPADVILLIVSFLFLILILRKANIWYWKINEHLENQKKIIFLLEGIKLNQEHYKKESL